MKLKRRLIGAAILATCVLCGIGLLLPRILATPGAFEQKCIDDQHRVLSVSYLRPREGVTQATLRRR